MVCFGRRCDVRVRRLGHCALLAGLLLGCGGGTQNHPQEAVPAPPTPTARLFVVTDLDLALEPCGCNSRPLGGIDRLGAQLAALDDVPGALLVAGNTFAGPERQDGEAFAEQTRLLEETLGRVLARLGTRALTPGPADLSLGAEHLGQIAGAAQLPLLRTGLVDGADGARPGRMTLRLGSAQVGVIGLTQAPEDAEPVEWVRAQAAALRSSGARAVVVLASASRRTTRRVARVPGVDLVIQAGVDASEPLPPSPEGSALVLNGGRQGQRLLVLDLYLRGSGRLVDGSAWTQRARAPGLLAQAETLRSRIASWQERGDVDPSDLTRQRARLNELERRAREAADARDHVPPEGNAVIARLVELAPDAERSDEIRGILDEHDRRVGEANRRVWAEISPPVPAEGEAAYVGAERCGGCHGGALTWWRTTPHGHAYGTLERAHKQYDLNCVACHLTGYRRPGGSNLAHVGPLASVGCEVCHGPGSAHAEAPGQVHLDASPTAEVCARCHTPAHSDLFDFEAYRTMLIVPGHGLPTANTGAAP